MQVPGAVLQGINPAGRPLDFSAFFRGQQLNLERQNQQQRQNYEKQARQNQLSQAVHKELDASQLTGDPLDPVVTKNISDTLSQADALIQKGASLAEVRTAIAPQLVKMNQYTTTMKTLHSNIAEQLQAIPKDQGYDVGKIKNEAIKQALYTTDDKGTPILQQDFSKIDPNKNYVAQVLQEHPENVMDMSGVDKFYKAIPRQDVQQDVTTTSGGKSNRVLINAKMNPYFEDYDRNINADGSLGDMKTDENGHPVGIVPKYEIAVQKDKNGNTVPIKDETGEPMRILKTSVFDDLMQNNPQLADAFRAEANRHFAAIGNSLPDNDPRKKLYVQHLAYDEALKHSNSVFHVADQEKQTAASLKQEEMNDPNYWKNLYKQSRVQDQARIDAKNADRQAHPENYPTSASPKEKAPEAIAKVFTNPATAIEGAAVENTPDGQKAYNIGSLLPKGKLNFKGGAGGTYAGVYYKPDTHELLLYKKDERKPEIVNAVNAGQFLTRIAEANGVPVSNIRPILNKYGYGKGAFNAKSEALNQGVEDAQSEEQAKKVNSFIAGKETALKGITVPDGTITGATIRGSVKTMVGMDKYSIDLINNEGKKVNKTFDSPDDLKKYLNQGKTETKKAILD